MFQASQSGVKVATREGALADAALIFATPDAAPFDVALLRIDPEEMEPTLRDAIIDTNRVFQG